MVGGGWWVAGGERGHTCLRTCLWQHGAVTKTRAPRTMPHLHEPQEAVSNTQLSSHSPRRTPRTASCV